MSIECLNQALKITGLTPTKKFILVILGNYADEGGTCYPSYSHIAKMVGLKDTKGVQRSIKEFETLGYLRIEHRITDKGNHTSNRYHLMLGMGINTPMGTETHEVGVTEPYNTKDDTKTSTPKVGSLEFDEFWKFYPRKIGKFQAKKIFDKQEKEKHQGIVHAAKVFAQESTATEIRFIPHPTTWLSQQRYLDFLDKPIKTKTLNNLAG